MPSDASRQNWKSGISWTVRGSTFFRNAATFYAGSNYVGDVWPIELTSEDTSYIQNQAYFPVHEFIIYSSIAGLTRRTGSSSIVHSTAHFDGGHESEGLTGFVASSIITLDPNDDPGATLDITQDRTTFVDHGIPIWGIVLQVGGQWPPRSDQQGRWNLDLIDFEMNRNPAVSPGGSTWDGAYGHFPGLYRMLVERSRFEGNGNPDSAAKGMGGMQLHWGGNHLPENRPHARFVDSTWRRNFAASGPAVGLLSGQGEASFDNCLMQGVK